MFCPAKINLTLHVGAPIREGRWAGYHPVDSLVVFASVGDRLDFQPSETHDLVFEGPFSQSLQSEPHNLVTRALEACKTPPQRVTLQKNLPVSAGLGGGSANAAGVLRQFDPEGGVDPVGLGADVPVCRLSRTAIMRGIGEQVVPLPGLGAIHAVLANPGIAVSTAEIFRRYDSEALDVTPQATTMKGSLIERALAGRNDLQSTAQALAPEIGELIDAIAATDGCCLSRMSGSGATCFGLYKSAEEAVEAANVLKSKNRWVVTTKLGDGAVQ